MLTDYHVHLRPDDVEATPAERYLTAENAERDRASATERGIAELGVAEHVYRFTQALDVWEHELWRHSARDDLDAYCAFVREETDLKLGIEADFIPGGEERMSELLSGRDFDYVVGSIHFVGDGAIAAAPVTDTIKESRGQEVVRTLDRSCLWAIQTPQVFTRAALERALDCADEDLAAATDDASLVESGGGTVRLVPASRDNMKVTTPLDLRVAELLLAERD